MYSLYIVYFYFLFDYMQYPKHVALIPDGNRTWAREKWMQSLQWHLEWFNRVVELAKYIFKDTAIDVFTVWWLSTENLKNRMKSELDYLFKLYEKITIDLCDTFRNLFVNFHVAWDISQLPDNLANFLREKEKEFTFPNSSKCCVLAVNYGGQDEILRAVKKLNISWEDVSKENLEKYMDFAWLPTVDLVIRTKQKLAKRLSGFMLWWIGYAQLYFTDLYCPDFTVDEFEKALSRWRETVDTQNYGK